MRYGWAAMLSLIVWGYAPVVAAERRAEKRRRFTPQAVVQAKQKLVSIAHGPSYRRRQDLRDALEELLVNYGLESARLSANDLILGNYGFLRAFPSNDRAALATVIADLVTLFPLPADFGLTERLRPALKALSKLLNDENPTVVARAQRLIHIAQLPNGPGNGSQSEPPELQEKWAQSTKSTHWIKIANAFLKRGRAGLLHYSGLTKPLVAGLTARQAELAKHARSSNPVVAERARLLLQVVAGQEVTERTAETLTKIARGFIRRGMAGLEDYTEIEDALVEELVDRLPELTRLLTDENPNVGKRASALVKVANRSSDVGFAGSTLKELIYGFLDQGKTGLLNGVSPSDRTLAALVKKLPALESLAQDEDATVAERAQWLIQIAHGRSVPGPADLDLRAVSSAFLSDGRLGLVLGRPLDKKQLVLLETKLPHLERLSLDEDPIVAERARWLIRLVTKRETSARSAITLMKVANAFLKRGRAGLSDYEYQPVTDEQRFELRKRLPELDALARDKVKRVADRAKTLIRIAQGKEGYKGAYGAHITAAFLQGDRAGILAFDGIPEMHRIRLQQKLSELEEFSHDEDRRVAGRAKILMRIANQEPVDDRSLGNIQHIVHAFFQRGRLGLLDYEAMSNEKIQALAARMPELEQLANDESPRVSRFAKALIDTATGANAEKAQYGGAYLVKAANAFLHRGRLGLLIYGGPGKTQMERLATKLDVLERLTNDDDPTVAKGAKALVSVVKGEADVQLSAHNLRDLAGGFLLRGRAGLIDPSAVDRSLAVRLKNEQSTLEALAMDTNADVAHRAKLLLRIINGEMPTSPGAATQSRIALSFLRFGRAGLMDYFPIPRAKIAQLKKSLPVLEGLLSDEDPTVAERAKTLIGVANGLPPVGQKTGSMKKMAAAFLSEGRDGLVAIRKSRKPE